MLTEEQLEAVETHERHCVVHAGAGSGKTLLITERASELVSRGVAPESIAILTFSRVAAQEIRSRLGDLGRKVHVGTFHSLILGVMAANGERPNVLDEEEVEGTILECAIQLGFAVKKLDGIKWKQGTIGKWRKNIEARTLGSPMLDLYLSKLKLRGDIDYVGIIYRGIELAAAGTFNPAYTIVDEAQDNDELQWRFVKLLSHHGSVMIVADENQCQPPGTMVRIVDVKSGRNCKTKHKDIPIEDVRPGDLAVAYGSFGRHFHAAGKPVEAVASRQYKGNLIQIDTYDKTTRCTEDHLCVIKLKDAFYGKHFVYLMRKGDQFRIGKAIGIENGESKRRFGFMARATAEGADAVWLISVHDTDMEARMQESILSLEYGIPQMVWVNRKYKRGATQEHLDEFWSRYKVDISRATALLKKYNRSILYPLWKRGQPGLIGKRLITTRAFNLMDGMNALCADSMGIDPKKRRWLPIKISRVPYEGIVYSLQVAAPHTYVADGLVTHNCIHVWRGAKPEVLRELPWKVYHLTETFRCPSVVVDSVNTVQNISLKLRTNKPGGAVIETDDVLGCIHAAIAGGGLPEDMAVLCRYNREADAWATILEEAHYPVTRRLPVDRGSFFWLLRYLSSPRSPTARTKCAKEWYAWLPQTTTEIVHQICSSRTSDHVSQLAQAWLAQLGVSVGPAEIMDAIDVPLMLRHESGMYASMYRGESLDYFRQEEIAEPSTKKESGGITVSTLHGSKGLEWETVFIPTLSPKVCLDECRLLYVGMTRAKNTLVMGDNGWRAFCGPDGRTFLEKRND